MGTSFSNQAGLTVGELRTFLNEHPEIDDKTIVRIAGCYTGYYGEVEETDATCVEFVTRYDYRDGLLCINTY